GAAGVALALVSVPLMLLLRGEGAMLVALVALLLYPLLDVPRLLGRPSWWIGAIVSVVVWIVLFIGLTETAESIHRMGDNAMVFLLPFMLYPLALAISGAVRLEGWLRGRPRETGPRRATIAVGGTYAVLVIGSLALALIPAVIEKITG